MSGRDASSERDAYHHGDLRRALLAQARAVVAEKGAEALSIRAATKAVGVDPAAAYRHFRRKNDILAAVAAEGFIELREAMRAASHEHAEREAEVRLVALGVAYATYGVARPRLYRLMFGGLCTTAEIFAALSADHPDYENAGLYELLTACLDDVWDEKGLAPEARDGAEFDAWCAMHGLVSLLIDGRGPYPASAATQRVERILRTLTAGWSRRG